MTQIPLFRSLHFPWRRFCRLLLAGSWCAGLLIGIAAANSAGTILAPMMRSAVMAPVSIVGLSAAALLPFLLSAYAVSISEPWLLLIISTFKAFGFSFCACAVSLTFGQSSWLVRFLFLFSDHCLAPVLYLYWLRHISGERNFSGWETVCFVAAAVLIGVIDFCLVSPFLATLI